MRRGLNIQEKSVVNKIHKLTNRREFTAYAISVLPDAVPKSYRSTLKLYSIIKRSEEFERVDDQLVKSRKNSYETHTWRSKQDF